MQVTHVEGSVTHAVISQNKAMDFGISNSAEFFNILSNTLYSDKILAVVREVLCNAWDIHIQTKRTDRAVSVTLTSEKLIIRDFGTGISKEDMHPIYAVYGNSTKKLDGNQTGGFGLGSKAPFAYVDHFEVISYHAGEKTVYAISKSSAEVAGKPGIMPLVTVPSTETGLSVSLAIQPTDRTRFELVIRTIAMFGEMNVELNGIKLPTVPFSEAKHGFLMMREIGTYSNKYSSDRYYIRYGNVLYPIPFNATLSALQTKIEQFLDKIGGAHQTPTMKIVFQAKPNTIAVTPSRESLSMTDRTIESIKELYQNFMTLAQGLDFRNTCIQIQKNAIAEIWKNGRHIDLLNSDNRAPNWVDKINGQEVKAFAEPKIISNVNGMARSMLSRTYPSNIQGFELADMNERFDYFEKSEYATPYMKGKIKSFRRFWLDKFTIDRSRRYKKDKSPSVWFQRNLVLPIIQKLDADDQMDSRKLQIFGTHRDNSINKNGYRRSYETRDQFVHAQKLSPRNDIMEYLPFLRNLIVISFNRIDLKERLPVFQIFREKYGIDEEFFTYIVSRNDKKLDYIRKFFANLGMNVIDLTKPGPHEAVEAVQPIAKPVTAKPVKPRKKGLPQLSAIWNSGGVDHTLIITDEKHARIENPQFIVQINPRAQNWSMGYGFSTAAAEAIIRLYGEFGGIVTNSNQHDRFVNELKISAVKPWILAKLKEEITTNPRLQLIMEMHPSKHTGPLALKRNIQTETWMKIFWKTPELCLQFDVANQITEKDILLWNLICDVLFGYYWDSYFSKETDAKEARKYFDDLKPSKEVTELVETIASSRLVGLLDPNKYAEIFGFNPTDHQKKQKAGALDILLYAMT